MSGTYRAAVCTALSGPASIEIQEQKIRSLESGEIRIAVKSVGLNFPDLLMTQGKYQFRPEPPFVPGLEAAGDVIEIAGDVTKFKVGDRVMAGNKGGALAEQFIVSEKAANILPDALSYEEGSCWQTAASTAWHALVEQGRLTKGESVLILGASGGVGMAAVKLARQLGAKVIGTGSTEAKRAVISNAGADHAFDPEDTDLPSKVKDRTDGKGVDVVYDPVGGDLAIKATRSIAWGGRYLVVGFASGDIPSFPANHILIKTYSVIGIRAGETPRRNPEIAKRQSKALVELAKKGAMRPLISKSFSLDDTSTALRVLEKREAIGRVVIHIP